MIRIKDMIGYIKIINRKYSILLYLLIALYIYYLPIHFIFILQIKYLC